MNRTAIYCRLSDEDRHLNGMAESESIRNQKSMLLDYALMQGWDIQNIYTDEDYSGTDQNRPAWRSMLRECELGRIDIVLCKSQSRFSREIEVVERYLHGKFMEWGVRFIGLADNADTAVFENKKSRQINGLANEWMIEDISINVRKTLRHKKELGLCTSSFAPYGYLIDPDNRNRFVVDRYAAEIIKDIFRMYRDGMGYVSICKELNQRKILSPSQYKKSLGSRFKTNTNRITSQVWTTPVIYTILRDEKYTGTMVQGKQQNLNYKSKKRIRIPEEEWIRVKGTHEPIITMEAYEAVQTVLKRRKRPDKATGKAHILAGKVCCMNCGCTMWKQSQPLATGIYEYLQCKATKVSTDMCSNKRAVRLDTLCALILAQLNQWLPAYYNASLIHPKKMDIPATDLPGTLLTKRDELRHLISKKESQLQSMYEDRLDGTLTKELYLVFSGQCSAEITRYQENIVDIERQLERFSQGAQETSIPYPQPPMEFSPLTALTREYVDEFVDYIRVGPLLPDRTRRVHIEWQV